MKYLGDTDTQSKIIKINKKLHHKLGVEKTMGRKKKKGELLDSLVHEALHAKHPKAHEKTIRKMTPKVIVKMGKLQKHKVYGWLG